MSKFIYLTSKAYEFTPEGSKVTYTGENHYVAEVYEPDKDGFMPEPRIRKVKEQKDAFKAKLGDLVLLTLDTEVDRKSGEERPVWKNIRHINQK